MINKARPLPSSWPLINQLLLLLWSLGNDFLEESPYEPVNSRLSDIFRLAPIIGKPLPPGPLLSLWRCWFTPEAVACFLKKDICVLIPPFSWPHPLNPLSVHSLPSLSTCSHRGWSCMLAGTGDPWPLVTWDRGPSAPGPLGPDIGRYSSKSR